MKFVDVVNLVWATGPVADFADRNDANSVAATGILLSSKKIGYQDSI